MGPGAGPLSRPAHPEAKQPSAARTLRDQSMVIGACAGLVALVITVVAIRVRREDLPGGMVVM